MILIRVDIRELEEFDFVGLVKAKHNVDVS